MARGDSIFGRVDVDWFAGEKTSMLTPIQRDLYLNGLWLQAVKIRRDVIPYHLCSVHHMTKLCTMPRSTIIRALTKCAHLGLITINPDKSITVHGVKEIHQRIAWRTDEPPRPLRSPYDPLTDCHEDYIREEEEEPLGNTSNKPSSLLTPTPPDDHPEGVHKSGLSRNGKPDSDHNHINPDSIISDIESIHSLAYEIIADFNLPPELFSEVSELISNSPASHIADARAATLDKIHAIAEDKTPDFNKGPLEYFAGILDNRTRKKDSDKP